MGLNGGCRLCPRECGIERQQTRGWCGADNQIEVSAVCLHRGEEPPLSEAGGIVNVFFTHCNLQCIYCQNSDIAARVVPDERVHYRSVAEVAERICQLLPQGNGLLGFVTAAHYAHWIPEILDQVRQRGFRPTVVYNSGGYESMETLHGLEGLVDIYLPDLKYMDPEMALRYSHAADYPAVATAAIKEMARQVGASLKCDERGVAYRGLVVRHLVLPGAVDNTLRCLDWLADNLPFSLHVSLMAQYFPPKEHLPSPLDRTLTPAEYEQSASRFETLGFNGWLQELEAESYYRPDFSRPDNPFEYSPVTLNS